MVLPEGQPSRHRGVPPPPAASPHPRWRSAGISTPSCARRSTWRPIAAHRRARTSGPQTGACHAPSAGTAGRLAGVPPRRAEVADALAVSMEHERADRPRPSDVVFASCGQDLLDVAVNGNDPPRRSSSCARPTVCTLRCLLPGHRVLAGFARLPTEPVPRSCSPRW